MSLFFKNLFRLNIYPRLSIETEGFAAPGGGSLAQLVWGVVLSEPTGRPICFIWLQYFIDFAKVNYK